MSGAAALGQTARLEALASEWRCVGMNVMRDDMHVQSCPNCYRAARIIIALGPESIERERLREFEPKTHSMLPLAVYAHEEVAR